MNNRWFEYAEVQNLIIKRVAEFDEKLANKVENSIDNKKPQFIIHTFERLEVLFKNKNQEMVIALDDRLILHLSQVTVNGQKAVDPLFIDMDKSEF